MMETCMFRMADAAQLVWAGIPKEQRRCIGAAGLQLPAARKLPPEAS